MVVQDAFWWFYKRIYRKLKARLPIEERGQPYRPRRYTGPFSEGLWGTVERAFSYSKGDGPWSQINRRAREEFARLGLSGLPPLDRGSCAVALHRWPVSRLAAIPRSHDRDRPRSERTPVIVLQIGPYAALLDGHTRVNKWSKAQAKKSKPVIVITCADKRGPVQHGEST